MENIYVTGTLGKNPEQKQVNGQQLTEFSIAANRGKKGSETQTTTWYNCAIWGKRGDTIMQYVGKGQKVLVSGEFTLRTYTGKDGSQKFSPDISVQSFDILSWPDQSKSQVQNAAEHPRNQFKDGDTTGW